IIRNNTGSCRLIVVDDCSPDERIGPLIHEKLHGRIEFEYIRNEVNLGFVKSVNAGYSHCRNNFVILNTDTEVPPEWCERLMRPFAESDDIASTTPFTNSGTICSFPDFMKDNASFGNLPVEELDGYFRLIRPDAMVTIPTGVGFCMGINKRIADEIGMFDEIYGRGYCEENDWCQRAESRGYRNVMIPNLYVLHRHGGTFASNEKKALFERNYTTLKGRFPHYERSVASFVQNDPMRDVREMLKIIITARALSSGVVMIIDHALGGGANAYSESLAQDESARGMAVCIVRFRPVLGVYSVEFRFRENEKYMINLTRLDELLIISQMVTVNHVYMNEAVSYPDVPLLLSVVEDIRSRYGSRLSVLIHDFFMVCPCFTLMDAEFRYCGISDPDVCGACLKKNRYVENIYRNVDINDWRQRWGNLLSVADDIVFFSGSSKDIVRKAYPHIPEERIRIVPHTVDYICRGEIEQRRSGKIRIGVIGTINKHKGYDIVREMHRIVKTQYKADVEIVIIGKLSRYIRGL
ncbi:MAG TPA: glycosyltransferase, partial [Spirochaetota bacterium]|nr:glycosyltransferase [Spirochaetota bacterium]